MTEEQDKAQTNFIRKWVEEKIRKDNHSRLPLSYIHTEFVQYALRYATTNITCSEQDLAKFLEEKDFKIININDKLIVLNIRHKDFS